MLNDEEKKFKASHFENIDELIKTCKMWIQDDDWDAYCRFFDKGAMEELINLIEKQQKEIEELNKENTRQHELIGNIHQKWKDKIKAKIKELEKGNKNTFIRGEKILVLQSLLKRSNNV